MLTPSLSFSNLEADLEFHTSSKNDYVRLVNLNQSLSEFTLGLWMKQYGTKNEETIFSYSSSASANTVILMIIDKKMYVELWDIEYRPAPVTTNGIWHYLAVTWENNDGNITLYIDGSIALRKTGELVGKIVPSQGFLYLGQDQDEVDGKLDSTQAFVGLMTQLNLWNRAFSEQEVIGVKNKCRPDQEGNVISWNKDVLSAIKGNILVHRPSSCK